MLLGARDLRGYQLHALDGDVGHVRDLFVEDDTWRVRWLVVDTGGWLEGRRVLVPALAAGRLEPVDRTVRVQLTRELVERGLDVDADRPVSRQHEVDLAYGAWPSAGWFFGGWAAPPGDLVTGPPPPPLTPLPPRPEEEASLADPHLRSVRHLTGFLGYQVHGTDGDHGHVADLVIDDDGWRVPFLVVDTSNWGLGRKVLVPTGAVGLVSWQDARVCVGWSRAHLDRGQPWGTAHAAG